MILDLKNIAPLVENQFPAFYEEDGQNFIQFVKAYYEWLDTQGPIGSARSLLETVDIDETSEKYLDYFLEKFMHGIPKTILGNKRFLEKHILDLYRSKGSVEGLKLLFRFLYNQEINVYVPQVDMLRASDGRWKRRKYLEVTNMPLNYTFNNKFIRGTSSGTVAYVESTLDFYLGDKICNVLYITNITPGLNGVEFLKDEHIIHDEIDLRDTPTILGSPVGAVVLESSQGFTPYELLEVNSSVGERLKYKVASIRDPKRSRGYINFKLIDGGFGYSLDSTVVISPGGNTTGSGATFKIGGIKNTSTFTYNTNYIYPVKDVLLSEYNYGATMNFANLLTPIDDALSYKNMLVGTISKLTGITSGDHNYDGYVVPNVYENRVYGYGIDDGKGGVWGGDAVITGMTATGNGVMESLALVSSGLGFNDNTEAATVVSAIDPNSTAEISIITGSVGIEEGYWEDTEGFLSSNKYIQDSDYYQEYSYEIQIEKSFEKYVDVLKRIMHPVGNKVFGKVLISDVDTTNNLLTVVSDILIQDKNTVIETDDVIYT